MIKINEKLTILHDDNSSFNDISKSMAGFGRDTETLTYTQGEDSIYIGFYKPINTFYIDFGTANTNAATLSLSYYNGSSFTAVDGLYDDSKGFTRPGFIRWNRGRDRDSNDEAKTTVNSTELYWYKLDLSATTTEIVINGINIVFSDDQDLKRELYEYSEYLPANQSTFILTHEAVRDEIIQDLNLKGRQKYNSATQLTSDVSAFDLLDVSEVKLAATHLALAKIMMNVSDSVDDLYMQKHLLYKQRYNNIINSMDLTIDHDDDGKRDNIEREKFGYGFIRRG